MHGGACAVLRLAVMEDWRTGGQEDRWFDGWDVGIMGLIPCVVVDDALMRTHGGHVGRLSHTLSASRPLCTVETTNQSRHLRTAPDCCFILTVGGI